MDVTIRTAVEADLDVMYQLMLKENWNVHINLLKSDLHCHPKQMLVAEKADGTVVGMIMAPQYGSDYGFGCGYVVESSHRRQGIGKLLWDARLKLMGSRNWVLDAVPDRIEPNIRRGFNPPEMEIKEYTWTQSAYQYDGKYTCCSLEDDIFDELVEYDGRTHPGGERKNYLKVLLSHEEKLCLVVVENSKVIGFLIGYPSKECFFVGFLKADNLEVADCLLSYITRKTKGNLSIQMPTLNQHYLNIVDKYQMKECYTLHRMWKQEAPNIDYSLIYAIPQTAIC